MTKGTDGDADDDRLVTIIGVVLVVAVVAALGVVIIAAANAPSGGTGSAPDASWSIKRINDTHVRVRHDGGEPVAAEDLVVTVGGKIRQVRWPTEGLVIEGDSVAVRARSGQTVRLFWDAKPGKRALLLSERV